MELLGRCLLPRVLAGAAAWCETVGLRLLVSEGHPLANSLG